MHPFIRSCLLALFGLVPQVVAQPMLDVLSFGEAASEAAHGLTADRSEIIKGGLGEPARRFLPPEIKDYRGGSAHFKLKVDGSRQNFLTVRLWGDDVSHERLVLFCEGKQLGYQHLGDIEILDTGSEEKGYNGRFYYKTQPLPMEITKGKQELNCEIRGYGRVWGYGSNFEQFQREMNEPTRGIYKLYVHAEGSFMPPANEPQGEVPAIKVREQPGEEVLDVVRQRMLREVKLTLQDKRPLGQLPLHFLARGWYHESGMGVAKDKRTPAVVAKGLDELWKRYQADPKMVEKGDPSVYNSDWFGAGFAGDVIRLLAEPLAKEWDQEIDDGLGGNVKRREAWCDMLVKSRDWLRQHRRSYTNQTMIIDMNIYRMNRGIAVLDASRALPEAAMLRYLHEAAGLEPWVGQ